MTRFTVLLVAAILAMTTVSPVMAEEFFVQGDKNGLQARFESDAICAVIPAGKTRTIKAQSGLKVRTTVSTEGEITLGGVNFGKYCAQAPEKVPFIKKVQIFGNVCKVRIGLGDLVDVGSTVYALNQGAIEANPMFSGLGNKVGPVGLIAKFAVKALLVGSGLMEPAQANMIVEPLSMGAGIHNLVLIAANADPEVAAVVGIVAGVGTYFFIRKQIKEKCPEQLPRFRRK